MWNMFKVNNKDTRTTLYAITSWESVINIIIVPYLYFVIMTSTITKTNSTDTPENLQ